MRSSLDAAFDYCRWLTARSGSNFSSSFLLLSPARRRAMEAVYAFCRAIDDIADRADAVPEEAQRELDAWRRELDACERGFPAHPIAVAVAEIRRRYSIPVDLFRKLIAGVEMDLRRRRYGTFEDLKVYCEHVASVVGLISVRVFGCRHPEADRYATELGIALQLTNILRDVKQDAEQGRVYIPSEETPASLAARARDHFKQADAALRSSGESWKLLPARIMGWVYARLLRRIEQSFAHPEPVEG